MYNLNTGQARTDLYGIDKGEAQVFDNKDYMAREERGAKFEQAKALQKQKQAADRQDDLLKSMAKVGGAKVKPGDLPLFTKDTQALYNKAVSSFDANGNISNKDYLDLMAQSQDLSMRAEASKNHREAIETEMRKYNPNQHYDAEYKRLQELYNQEGGYGELPSLQERVNINDYTNKVLVPEAEKEVARRGYGTHSLTDTEAIDMLDRSYKSDPNLQFQVQRQASEDLGKNATPDEAREWWVNNQKDRLKFKVTHERPASTNINVGGVNPKLPDFVYDPEEGIAKITPPADKKDVVNEVVVGGKTLKYKTPNPRFDSKGNLVGGEYIQTPTTEQQKDNKRYIDIQETLRDNEIDNADTEKEIQAIYDKYDPIIAKVPYPEKVIQTNDKNEIDKLIKIAYGVKAEGVMKGDKSGVNYVEASENKPKTIGGKTYNSFLEYYEANKSNKQKITLRDEWNRGNNNKAETKDVLTKGVVVNGYKYIGGDSKNPKNWIKQ